MAGEGITHLAHIHIIILTVPNSPDTSRFLNQVSNIRFRTISDGMCLDAGIIDAHP